jgi:prephenate dehydratase
MPPSEIRVAFQGIKGAFSEDAIYQSFGPHAIAVACPEFEDVFRSVDSGETQYGMVPVENSLEGSVARVNDLLLESDLTVVAESYVVINHCLIVHPGARMEDIKRVYSHPQALGQCRSFLLKHPSWEKVPYFDTAGSVKFIKERNDRSEAAVASRRAAEEYGLKVMEEGIQSNHNITRFFAIEKRANILPEGDKTSLVFSTRNIAGALHNCLGSFAERGVNMTKLESRPRKERTWEYVFYADIDGHVQDEKVSKALADLVRRAGFVKILGSYKKGNLSG